MIDNERRTNALCFQKLANQLHHTIHTKCTFSHHCPVTVQWFQMLTCTYAAVCHLNVKLYPPKKSSFSLWKRCHLVLNSTEHSIARTSEAHTLHNTADNRHWNTIHTHIPGLSRFPW